MMIGGNVSSLARHLIKSLTAPTLSSKLLLAILAFSYSRLGGLSQGLRKNVQRLISNYYVFKY